MVKELVLLGAWENVRPIRAILSGVLDRKVIGRWYMNLERWSPEMLVFVNEPAANERTLDRRYGWAPRGIPAIDTQVLHSSTRWSILPAYTINKYLENTLVKQGSVDSKLFSDWLCDYILPQCTPYPGPRIMDNCSTH